MSPPVSLSQGLVWSNLRKAGVLLFPGVALFCPERAKKQLFYSD